MAVAQRGTLWELITEAKTLLEGAYQGFDADENWLAEKNSWIQRLEEIVKMEAEERPGGKAAFMAEAYGASPATQEQAGYTGSPAEDAEKGRHMNPPGDEDES